MTEVLQQQTDHRTKDNPPNKFTSQQRQSKPLTALKLRQKQQERVFDFIDPLKSLLDGLYKYKEETDRKVLLILADKMKKSYGETVKFKDTSSVLKYAWKIEDGEPISSLEITKEDIYDASKVHVEDTDELEEASQVLSQEEMYKKSKNRLQVGVNNSAGNSKAPNLEYTCKVCMDQAVSVTFIPCGHLVVCGACAPALGDCPVCRQTVKGTISTKF